MAVLHPKGLLEGRRLRKCSPLARFLWPYLFSMSNGFARLELDYELLEERLFSFKELRPDQDKLASVFKEYANNHLILIYEVNGATWGQWDTKKSDLKKYKSSDDEASPNPNQDEYQAWLQQQHGERWEQYFCGSSTGESAFTKHLRKSAQNVSADLPNVFVKAEAEAEAVGIGVGKAVGIAVAEGNGIGTGIRSAEAVANGKANQYSSGSVAASDDSFSSDSVSGTGSAPFSSSLTDETGASSAQLVSLFDYLTAKSDHPLSGKEEDFQKLLEEHSYNDVAEMIVWSLTVSNYWSKHLASSRHFRNSFKKIETQAASFENLELRKLRIKFEQEMAGADNGNEFVEWGERIIPAEDDDEDFA